MGSDQLNILSPYSTLTGCSGQQSPDEYHHTVHGFYVSRKEGGGTKGSGWGHLQGDMHMAARLGCKSAMGGISCPGCMDRLRKRYSHVSIQALTPKLNPSPLPALTSRLMNLTMSTE